MQLYSSLVADLLVDLLVGDLEQIYSQNIVFCSFGFFTCY